MTTQEQEHWNNVYTTKAENEVSWFEPYPKTSMEFVRLAGLPLNAKIIDIGGGDSHFVDALLDKGYQNISVLDISAMAIERSRQRLKDRASSVQWIVADVTKFEPPAQFDFWHDRAAFHFLTTEDKIAKYVSIAESSIKQDGYLILGTFSEKGPKKCSGLETKQYSERSIAARFEKAFNTVKCIQADHLTPFDDVQNFLFCCLRKKHVQVVT